MAKQYYLPTTESGKLSWLTNFAVKLPTHAGALGVTAAEIAIVQADRDAFVWVLQLARFVRNTSKEILFGFHQR